MITTSTRLTTSTMRARPASTRSRSVHYLYPGRHQVSNMMSAFLPRPSQSAVASPLSILSINSSSFVSSLKNKIVQVPVTRKPVTVHVPQNVPVNFVPVHVPTQDLGPLSVVELDPFGNKTLLSVNILGL